MNQYNPNHQAEETHAPPENPDAAAKLSLHQIQSVLQQMGVITDRSRTRLSVDELRRRAMAEEQAVLAEREALRERACEEARHTEQAERTPDTADAAFSAVAAAALSVSAAQWASENGWNLKAADGGWVCADLPGISFYEDGSWADRNGKGGTAFAFACEVQHMSCEQALLAVLESHYPQHADWLRTRPSPLQKRPEIELMHPRERLARIRGERAGKDSPVSEKPEKLHLTATPETAKAAACGRDAK